MIPTAEGGFPVDEMSLYSSQSRVGGRSADSSLTAPSATRGPVGNLPHELTSFVGRRHELAESKRLLSASRLVTLTGIGGVGKTRLALRLAQTVHRQFPDGVWLVELGELRDTSLLADVVAAALGVRDRSARPVREVLVDFLDLRRLLLVIDNCEQVIDAVAALAKTLLRACPELKILTTSREPLGIGGEAALRVPPLAAPDPDRPSSLQGLPGYDAVTLFTQRATSSVPDFRLTDDNTGAVARICAHLDGLPLPIELAAARLRAMSVEQILQRLTDRYALLTLGDRAAPSRQQTLRLCIDWSHDLCTPLEQQLWSRLSVFAGTFELDAAEAICGTDIPHSELLDTVASLVDKSILIREQPGAVVRFRMLETLRDYGRENLRQAGGEGELLRRHRDWYHQLVVEAEAHWISPRQLDWITRLAREQPNLREAMEFCISESGDAQPRAGLQIAVALYRFWLSRALFSEGRRWLDRILSTSARTPSTDRMKALYAASVFTEIQGDLPASKALVEESYALAQEMNDPISRALAAHADGLLGLFSGNIPRASALLNEALEIFASSSDLSRRLEILNGLGLAYASLDDMTKAVERYEQALAITSEHGESAYRSHSLWALGLVVWRQGRVEQARELFEESLHLTRLVDDPLTGATCLESLAWIAGVDGQAHRAAVLLGAAEAFGRSVQSTTMLLPRLYRYHEDCERSARETLGRKAFDAARSAGRTMTFAEAVAYALDNTAPDKNSSTREPTSLTKREWEVARLVARGMTNKAIAAELVIAQRTAQGHVEHVLAKLGFTSRAQIAAWVVGHGSHG
ncbi:LuxR family transcriptional regulator [Rhodococcus oxybenzonivorans]|uniref:LuxR family transcriptional regulator n=1 Tax=Rhodococcus oxybenzonivorans TaxID=1990687 RepID=A0A2S2BWD8_9NOCA|nr:LuxR family transcriptional regulator [Rhodococcus oxybenzonivorans]